MSLIMQFAKFTFANLKVANFKFAKNANKNLTYNSLNIAS